MARTYARIRVDIWRDDDWCKLSLQAQWLYLMLLGQSKMSMAGCIVMRLSVWAHLADVEADEVRQWLGELDQAGMVAIDDSTEELVIRTFTTHDGVFRNQNLGRGMWAAWESIDSPMLRQVVTDNLPPEAWETRFSAPIQARQMRASEGRS